MKLLDVSIEDSIKTVILTNVRTIKKRTIMKTKTKYIFGILLSFILMSCQFNGNFGVGVKGNGNVIKEDRVVTENFNSIEVSRGMDVYLTQNNNASLMVEADENLHDIIITEVENNTLKIYADENISSSKSKKVFVNFKDVNRIVSTSGSDIYSTNIIKAENLKLKTTSGSDMELEIEADVVECESTSGSDLRLAGTANKLYAKATSGSDIKAGNLKAEYCKASATSGADIILNTTDELYAKASSGGDIKYYGNPDKISKNDSASGNISKQ